MRGLLPAIALLLLAPSAQAEPAKPIPLRDFFRNPERSRFAISPDGKTLSFLRPYQRRKNLFVQPVAGGEPKRITAETERDIREYMWKGNDRLVYLKDFAGDENFHVFSVKSDGSELKDLTPFPKVRAQLVDERPEQDGEIYVELNKRNPEVFDVFRLEVGTGKLTLLAENPGKVTQWVPDHAGVVRAAVETDGVNSKLLYREDAGKPFRTIVSTNFREELNPLLFTFDDKKLYVSSNLKRDRKVLAVFDPAAVKEEKVLFEHPEVDVSDLEYSHKRKVLTEAVYVDWKTERKFFDPEMEALHRKLAAKLPGYEIDLVAHNKDETVFIVATSNDRTQGARYVYQTAGDKLTKLGDIAPWLPEEQMAQSKPIEYKTRDGLTIHGYLTLPRGKPAKGLPMVVNPHGGPWARDVWGWDPEVQLLANRGYAVLQVNFRGSTGYGRKFWEASFKQWGKKMQDDVSDGVKYVVSTGIADARKICIYGGSYGGYATLAGLAFSPELYACGVDYVGVSNLFTFLKTIPPYWRPMLDMVHEMVGDPVKDKALMEAASPVMHVDRIRAPLFVAQGKNDPRVNVAESDQMVAALKKRGIEVPYMVKADEGHGFHNEENRFDFYEAMEKFLAQHLK
jgi:dipeptidyl aminopeptidase/acylaminoacyl peptidase